MAACEVQRLSSFLIRPVQTIDQVQPVNKRLRYVSFLPKAGHAGVLQDITRDRASLPELAVNVRRLFLDAGSPAITHGSSALQIRRLQASGLLAAMADDIPHIVGAPTAVQEGEAAPQMLICQPE